MMRKIIKSEEFWVVFLIIFSVGISLSLFVNEIYQGRNLPAERFQTFEHNFLPDFNAYLSKMTQGGKGGWLVYERMTNEPHEPSLLQIFYLILGKITIGIMGLRADLAYHFARFVLAVVRLLAGYYFICAVFDGRTGGYKTGDHKGRPYMRILAFALFIFAGNFPFKIINPAEYGVQIGEDKYRLIFEVWTNLDPLTRLSYLPHWMAGQSAIMVGLGMIVRAVRAGGHRDPPLQNGLIVGLIGMVGGVILPSVPLIIISVWFVMTIIYRKNMAGFLLGSILMAIPLFYIKWVTGFLPWSALAESDRGVIMRFPWEGYIKALGVLGVGLGGAMLVMGGRLLKSLKLLKKDEGDEGMIAAGFWVLVTFGMIWVFDRFLHYDQRRFIQVGVELPLAVLTAWAVERISTKLLKYLRLLRRETIVIAGVVVMLLIPSVFVWYISYVSRVVFVKDRMMATRPVSATPYVVYPLKDWMEGIFWLSKNTTVNDVVFSDYVAGNYIAGYAGNRVYAGHGGQTVDYLNKLGKIKFFFEGKMKETEAKLFLANNYVKYVFVGPQEAEYGGTLKYSFLELVYTGRTTRIYRINFQIPNSKFQ